MREQRTEQAVFPNAVAASLTCASSRDPHCGVLCSQSRKRSSGKFPLFWGGVPTGVSVSGSSVGNGRTDGRTRATVARSHAKLVESRSVARRVYGDAEVASRTSAPHAGVASRWDARSEEGARPTSKMAGRLDASVFIDLIALEGKTRNGTCEEWLSYWSKRHGVSGPFTEIGRPECLSILHFQASLRDLLSPPQHTRTQTAAE